MLQRILDYLPVGMFLLSLFYFYFYQRNEYTTIFYLLGTIANVCVNVLLKIWLREPRPGKTIHSHIGPFLAPFNNYGMPSGHAQFATYSLVYFYFVTRNTRKFIALFTLTLFTFFTLLQRVYTNAHTVQQVVVGAFVGSLLGALVFVFLQKATKKKEEKPLNP